MNSTKNLEYRSKGDPENNTDNTERPKGETREKAITRSRSDTPHIPILFNITHTKSM